MNHLGKENSFSFQRTIHSLNEGLKLIIRGGLFMKKGFVVMGGHHMSLYWKDRFSFWAK